MGGPFVISGLWTAGVLGERSVDAGQGVFRGNGRAGLEKWGEMSVALFYLSSRFVEMDGGK